MKQFLRKNRHCYSPSQQTNAFRMYVKKGWYGLPVVLLLLFVTVMSCNRQIQQTPDLSNKNKPPKTENKQNSVSNDQQQNNTLSSIQKPQYGTYFTNLAPEYAWLDTLTVEHLIQYKWIEYTKDERNKNTEEIFHLGSGHFKKTFTKMLPQIPIDSFMIYTAHWYGVNNDIKFDNKERSTNYYHSCYYKQYYEGTEISDHYALVKFDLQHSKPTTFQFYLARNLNLNLIDKPFPYDSLYVLASDSLRMPNGNKYDEFYYDVYETMGDAFKYNPLEYPLYEKYRKKYFRFDGSNYSLVTEINVYGNNKLYEFIFDMQTIKLLSVTNIMNYCFSCNQQALVKETSKNLDIYYYNGTNNVVSPGIYPSLTDNSSLKEDLTIKYCDNMNNVNIIEPTELKSLDIYNSGIKITAYDFYNPPTPANFICWTIQQNILANTYYFSTLSAHQFFTDNFGLNLSNLITRISINHDNPIPYK